MRIERLSLKGLLGFSDTVSLDLRDVGPGLIAITGPNGAGKTTILEAALATLQRKFITRDGPLHEYAGHRRDSYLDVDVALDGVGMYRARVNIDGLKSTSDAVLELVQANGTRTVLNDGKASTFDVAVAAHFPSRAVLLASNFAAQNKKGSFTASDKRARKDLFGAILGLEQYQTLSDTAKQAAAFVDHAIGRLRATRDTLARDTADGVVAALDSLARMLQVDGGTAEVRQRELATAIERADERLAALADEVAAHAALTLRVRDLETQLATWRAEQVQLDVDRGRATRQADEDLAQLTRASDTQLTEIDELLTNNRRLLANADAVKDAKVALGLATSGLEDARTLEGELRQALDVEAQRLGDLRSRQSVLTAARKDLTRAEMDARTLTVVPCHGEGAYAACQFLHNAREAAGYVPVLQAQVADEDDVQAAIATSQAERADLTQRLDVAKERIARLQADVATHQKLAGLHDKLVAAETRVEELTRQRAATVDAAVTAVQSAEDRHTARIADLDTRALALDAAEKQVLADLLTARQDLHAHTDAAERAIALQVELRTLRTEWDGVTATLARVASGRAELDRRRAEVQTKRARVAELDAVITTQQTHLLDWQLLAKAFGRDGLPVLEMDAAGPTITALVNQLLEVCFGSRFSVELITQRPKADGKGFVDDFTIHVFDNLRGGDPRDLADLSGGEQVIVAEALMNAIAVYVNTRSPVPVRTCWRDETTGALDPENATRYLAMLRKVQELGGFHHVLFVTHNADAARQADAQIQVADGQAVIVRPPFVEAAA